MDPSARPVHRPVHRPVRRPDHRLALPVLASLCLHMPLAAATSMPGEPSTASSRATDGPYFPDPPALSGAVPGPFMPDPPAMPIATSPGSTSVAHGGPFFPDPPPMPTRAKVSANAPGQEARPAPPIAGRTPRESSSRQSSATALDTPFARAFDATVDFSTPADEPSLGAALDGPVGSVGALDEHRRRLARHGAWLGADAPTVNARQLLARIADADAHGLDPARYDLDGLREGLRELFDSHPPRTLVAPHRASARRATSAQVPAGSTEPAPVAFDAPARAALVYRFDRAFTRLAGDLGRGIVNAREVQTRLYRKVPDVDIAPLREALARGNLDVAGALDSIAPTHERYRRLVEATRELLAERVSGLERTRVDENGALEAGDHHPDIMRIKRRLIETGELSIGTVITPMFDSELVLAVEAFRRRNGLPPASIVDRRMRDALNLRVEDELDALALSLERWRWMPRELGERHVFVNLPDYRLTLDNGDQRIVDMPVVIGARAHPTPSFSRDMAYLEFNPTWTVPPKIAYNELLPIERRRPGYLKSRNFDFMKVVNGQLEKVPHESVDRTDLDLRPFPYYLRQRGGPGNALGRMKFMMPNPHAIYLHDTPARRHFSLHERAYSHGCIRLRDPDLLAKVVLQIDGRSLAEAEELIESRTTRRARLARPLPTHLAYFTTWVDERGALQRRTDVYGHDKALRTALQVNGALPSARRMASR